MSEQQKFSIISIGQLLQVLLFSLVGYYFNALNTNITELQKNVNEVKIAQSELAVKLSYFSPTKQISLNNNMNRLVKKNATVEDTVNLVKKVAKDYQYDSVVSDILNKYPLTKNIDWFHYTFNYIASITNYAEDLKGMEQIKTPNCFVLKNKYGDCDDFTVLWGALLNRANLAWQPKIVMYSTKEGWAHIYPIVPIFNNTKYLVLDNVLGTFASEVEHINSRLF